MQGGEFRDTDVHQRISSTKKWCRWEALIFLYRGPSSEPLTFGEKHAITKADLKKFCIVMIL